MENINWTVWLLAAAGGVVVGMIVLAIGMWIDTCRAERLDAQALRPLPRRTPGASLNDDSGA